MQEVYIVSAVRTPIGSFGGALSSLSATDLGSIAIKGAIEKAGIKPELVEEVLMGNVISANLGQAPARIAALKAGLPHETRCTTINKVCASGAKAIIFAAQSIMLGMADVIVAGGMESMSNAPYYVPRARFGYKYGSSTLVDGLEKDGLSDAYDDCAMGIFADKTARKYGITREDQDDFAIESYRRSAEATQKGYFADEIIPVEVQTRKGVVTISEDEEYKNVNFEKIPNLKPAFEKKGTVTAANASTLNDGAAALVLMSKKKAEKLKLTPLAKIIGFADAEQEPAWFTTTPTVAVPKAIRMAGLIKEEVDLFEVNEAFAVVPLAFEKLLDIPQHKINVLGGAVSLGHPLGASGARIVTTLISALTHKGGRIGAAGICNGGGGASAIVIEKM
ncbi:MULTISPECIES: acetyl-CoA C-acyltransferase [Flectobacillus]|jgi:acetyl-CoA C-acetyltransferase|uniref:acetyl-CoA C-acetyltransferase n=1 Tax=Flectobacillus roseus TaxID=502259 RepID=A0ABT6Y809_9BACT|nr:MULTISPECIES: acetyl-CoA C-acyltransferase [Flectobacillus]MDI9859690.1 acetyl-CoA C-acyltransferase [Flectobacillus roseus]MDI9868834.1 acetyl-CoA C-acyltransferase [Flectobacillus roseus]NBA74214.1 acetyl-CoA C-acyltransferase [Emticicia sp. ODNR4P]PAC30720.1 acetyl-CoA acetyltransferase [Flectobacillus sp. BAB-3569]